MSITLINIPKRNNKSYKLNPKIVLWSPSICIHVPKMWTTISSCTRVGISKWFPSSWLQIKAWNFDNSSGILKINIQPTGVIISQILVPPWGQFKPIFGNFSWPGSVLHNSHFPLRFLIKIYPVIKPTIK